MWKFYFLIFWVSSLVNACLCILIMHTMFNSFIRYFYLWIVCVCRYFQFGWTGTPDLANSIAMERLPLPSLIVVNATTMHHHLPEDPPHHLTPQAIQIFLDSIIVSSAPVSVVSIKSEISESCLCSNLCKTIHYFLIFMVFELHDLWVLW